MKYINDDQVCLYTSEDQVNDMYVSGVLISQQLSFLIYFYFLDWVKWIVLRIYVALFQSYSDLEAGYTCTQSLKS